MSEGEAKKSVHKENKNSFHHTDVKTYDPCLRDFMSMDPQKKQLTWVFKTVLFFCFFSLEGLAWSRTCLPSIYFTGAMYVYNLFTSFEDLNLPHQSPPRKPVWLLMSWLGLAKSGTPHPITSHSKKSVCGGSQQGATFMLGSLKRDWRKWYKLWSCSWASIACMCGHMFNGTSSAVSCTSQYMPYIWPATLIQNTPTDCHIQ